MGEASTTRLELAVGERHSVPLRALATAGYSWSASVGGPEPGAVTVDVRHGEAPPGAPPGLSAPETAVVQALAPGSALVRLEQRRRWEAGAEPAATVELHVQVR